MLKRLTFATLAIVCVPLALTACAHRSPILFSRPTAAEVGPEFDNYGEAVIPAHGRIVVQGDDLVYGDALRGRRPGINGSDVPRTRTSITEWMRRVVRGPTIVNLGYPGDTAIKGALRWQDQPVGNLLILSYGFGDAAAKTPIEDYSYAMRGLIQRAHAAGAAVFVVPTPSTTNATLNAALAPYQSTARAIAVAEGAEVFEPGAEFARVKTTASRGVAQTPMDYEAIAGGLVPYIRTVPLAPSASPPQSGQAGSALSPTTRVSPARAS